MNLADLILDSLKSIWNFIKRTFIYIVNFFTNIVGWFREPQRLKTLRANKNAVAAVVKQKLKSGDYAVVNVLYNQTEDQIMDAEIIEAKKLDNKTKESFKNHDVLILQ